VSWEVVGSVHGNTGSQQRESSGLQPAAWIPYTRFTILTDTIAISVLKHRAVIAVFSGYKGMAMRIGVIMALRQEGNNGIFNSLVNQ
jgi:hypothetical protein